MKPYIIYDPAVFVTKLADVLDNASGIKFLDTSTILSPPIEFYNEQEQKFTEYEHHDFQMLSTKLVTTPIYNKFRSQVLSAMNAFALNMTDLLDDDVYLTPLVQDELADSKRYCDRIVKRERIRRPDRATKRFADVEHPVSGRNMHKIHHSIEQIAKITSGYIAQTLQSRDYSFLAQLRDRNEDKYIHICDAVSQAFKNYRIQDRLKKHGNTNDAKILSEIMLYSHLLGEDVTFVTADKDFLRMADRLPEVEKTLRIQPGRINIVHKTTPVRADVAPHFRARSIITYDGRFKVVYEYDQKN